MKSNCQLSSVDRAFFALVNQATLCNPFSDERAALDLKIAAGFPDKSDMAPVDQAIEEIARKLAGLEMQGYTGLPQFCEGDRELMESAYLFDFFHRFAERFDDHIQKQIKAGDKPLTVTFAREALALLRRRGFDRFDAVRYFALCFQVRRAFYFIDHSLVGRSAGMQELRRKLWNNVFTQDIDLYKTYLWNRMEDFSTLILGDTGTGKGASAAAIGRSGFIPFDEQKNCFVESFTRSFTALNLSQFSETLIESELFGHKKGAFTGAVEDYKGIFDRCSPHGSIFLDEIGELAHPIQIKLLQVLQERFFYPVGSHQKHRFKGRVIAATNRNMQALLTEKKLREDFYYRLCSDVIVVPPLRVRIEEDSAELDDLLGHTVNRLLGQASPALVAMIKAVIIKDVGPTYAWPGNVRELEQAVRSILLNRTYAGHWDTGTGDWRRALVTGMTEGQMDARTLVEGYCYLLYQRLHTYEAVARQTQLDRRTVKKYVVAYEARLAAGLSDAN